tara:strand:+ start:462 stop:890 length:429 start_codon:yes stop_codon:yes gene_type:complete
MARVPRTAAEARANLQASLTTIQARYEQGVRVADWEEAASSDEAEANYAAGVQEAVSLRSRQARIREVGNAHWRSRAEGKGAAALANGIRESLGKYEQNFGRVLQAIQGTLQSLPPRTRDWRTNIETRQVPVVEALVAAKLR